MSFNPIAAATQQLNPKLSKSYLDARVNVILAEKGKEGLEGFLFDIPENENVNLSADMTDHYTEDNSFLQDHRVIKPAQITISGFVGELVYKKPTGLLGALSAIGNRLNAVGAFLGDQTPQAIQVAQKAAAQAQAAIGAASNIVGKAKSLTGAFKGASPEPTKQQVAYKELESLFRESQMLTLQTPWNFFDNLMITAIGFSQSEESEGISDIQITLKEIRVAKTKVADFDTGVFNRSQIQESPGEDLGVTQGEELTSIVHGLVIK